MNQEVLHSIKSSETETKIKDSTSDIIKESHEILAKLKEKFWENSPEYQKVKKEYDDVQKNIIESLKNDRKITQEELNFIELEFTNLLKMKVWDSAVASVLNQTWKLARWLWADSSKVDFLWDSVKVTNQYQEDLIKKVLWADYEKWYNDKYLKGYNNTVWNFLVKIEDFEKQLQDGSIQVKDINSRALWNYFLYLKSKGKLTPENIMDLFGANKLYELREVWEEKDPDAPKMRVTKQIMQENGLGDIIKVIELFSSPDNFLAWIQELSKNQNQAHIAFKLFEKNTNSIKQQFKTELKNKFLKANPGKQKEADEIINEMMGELDKNKSMQSLPQVLKIFHDYNEKHKLGLSISEEARKLIGVRKQENQLEIAKVIQEEQQAIESKDEKALGKIAKRKQQLTVEKSGLDATDRVVSKTSDIDIKKIISWEVRYEDHISDLMKKDEVFRETMMRFQQEQSQFYEDYPEEKKTLNHQPKITEDTSLIEMYAHANTLSYPDGSLLHFEPTSWGNYKIDGIEISYREFYMVKKDKDIYKNIQHFQQTLQELNLEWLWKYRQSLFNAISSKYVGSFEIQNDYMNAREIKIFISSVLSSIGVSLSPDTPTEEFKQKVKYVNKVWILGGQEDINVRGEWFIESKFLDKFDPRRTGMIFPHVVESEIWNLFWESV